MGAVFHLPAEHRLHQPLQLLLIRVPAGLDGGLTGHGVQNLIPGGGGVRGLAPAQLFADLLHRGLCVLRQHIRRHGAQDIFILSKRLQLKTQLGKKCAVFFQQLSILAADMQRYRAKKPLAHDLPLLLLQPVKDHPLVGGVLVNENQSLPLLHNDVGL